MPSFANSKSEKSPFKLVLWTAIAGLIFGLIGFGELPEDLLRASRNSLHPHQASGEIVVVSIDDNSLRAKGRWPWPRRLHADLIEKLTAAGANRIFFDVVTDSPSNAVDDRLLGEAIERSGRVTLPIRGQSGPFAVGQPTSLPLETLSGNAKLGSIAIRYNYQNVVWHLPYAANIDGKLIPSFAASLANR